MKKRYSSARSKKVEKMAKGIIALACVMMVALILFSQTGCGIISTFVGNSIEYAVKKVDDATNYDTIKKVEDTCRAMISSYESDALTYEQYKDSDNEEKQSWAEQAKMRANKTASTYNNYILENSFVWEGNVPADIKHQLKIIE